MSDKYEIDCGICVGGWQNPLGYNERYAVLIDGWYYQGHFWNNIVFAYDTLISNGYTDENIYVLYYDGTDADPEKQITDFPATKTDITNVFDGLNTNMGSDDFLFVYLTDEGKTEGNYVSKFGLCQPMDYWEWLYDHEFAAEVDKITSYARMSINIQSCKSGGFIDDLSRSDRVITTSAPHNQVSWGCKDGDDGKHYSHYSYHFLSALNSAEPGGTTVRADTSNYGEANGFVSIAEAYNYALDKDTSADYIMYDDDGIPGLDVDGPGYHGAVSNGGEGYRGSNTYI